MRLYTCNLFKMLSWLRQFKFRRFGKNVIQFLLAYLETQLQYTVQFMWPFQGCDKFKCHFLVIVYLGFVSLSAWVFYCSVCLYVYFFQFLAHVTLKYSSTARYLRTAFHVNKD